MSRTLRHSVPLLVALLACAGALASLPATALHAAAAGSTVSWPPGQALPRFAAPQSLDVVDMASPSCGCSSDDALMLSTLEGVVNRALPRVYVLQFGDETPASSDKWLNGSGVPYTVTTESAVITKYRSELAGVIEYDPNVPDTVNVATAMAGVQSAVVAGPGLAATLNSTYGLPILANLADHHFSGAYDAYAWALDNVWPQTTHRMLAAVPGAPSSLLRDYAVANQAMVVWLDPTASDQASLLDAYLSGMPANSPYLGWFPNGSNGGEQMGVAQLSRHAVYTVAADLFANMTVYSGIGAPSTPPPSAQVPPLESRIYVTLTITDGDNLQYAQHFMRQMWDDPNRGAVPLNWSMQPLLVDAAPSIMHFYQATASPNDWLTGGPSGAGYMFTDSWPSGAYPAFTAQTGNYLRAAGLSQTYVYSSPNRQGVYRDGVAQAYAQNARPGGVMLGESALPWRDVIDGVPVVNGPLVCGNNIASTINRLSAGWNGVTPLFLSIGVIPWCAGLADVVNTVHGLDGRYAVVRADQLLGLVHESVSGGYWMDATDGGIFSFGGAPFYGSTGNLRLNAPMVGMAPTPHNGGYWLVAADGGVFSFGNARFHGSMGGRRLAAPVVGMTTTAGGLGYWLVAGDGGIFSFGDAQFHGSTGAIRLNRPVVGMAPTPDGGGYWLVASDGGIFSFGDAQFYGSTGAIRLNQPVVGMAPTPDGGGYWLVAGDGGIFSFGDAQFYGSTGSLRLNRPVVGMSAMPDGGGYWLAASDGGIFAFGSARFNGSTGSMRLNAPVVGMAGIG
jgi:GxGYxYP putative glycoside hydrolase C-terminal domain/GxGYxY sequence motif in domain of unknown function N-terminal